MSDNAVIIRILADGFADLARRFAALDTAGPHPGVKSVGDHLKDAGISAEQVDALKDPKVAKADKAARAAAKAKAEAAEAPKPEEKVLIAKDEPKLTPEQIAADLKAKLVALVNKNRAKAVAILAASGAKNFSTIPVEKHPEVLLAITSALAACEENDPLA